MADLLDDLLKQKPEQVQKWLQQAWSEQLELPGEVSWWLGLAESAAVRAKSSSASRTVQERLLWAELAIMAYGYLARVLEPAASHRFELSAMALRMNMIREFGVLETNFVLDPEGIEEWFLAALPYTIEEAESLVARPGVLSDEESHHLSTIMRRFLPVQGLLDAGCSPRVATVWRWAEVVRKWREARLRRGEKQRQPMY